jgi:hypothetical protein
MDRTTLYERLMLAERHTVEAERNIARQRKLVMNAMATTPHR